jgi:signal transduction histidine kinase
MHINWFFISSLTLSITELFLIIILLKYGKEKVHRVWTLLNIAVFVWASGATITNVLNFNYQLIRVAWRVADVGVTFIPSFLLHMVFLLTKQVSKKILFFSYAQAFIFAQLVLKSNFIKNDIFQKYNGFILMTLPGRFYLLWFAIWSIIVAYAHFCLIKFYSKQKKEEKKHLKSLLFLFSFGFISGTINFLYFLNTPLFPFANLGIVVYCLISTYAIFKHQILGIEIIYKRGLLYSILIAIFTAVYLGIVFIFEWLFRGIVGYKSFLLSLSSAFALALLFNPLRNKIQTFIDRFFLGKTPQEIAQENELLKQELERSERLKAASTLALGLAHEVKNPLTTIKTFAEFLPQKYNNEDFVDKFSKLIPIEVERINNIIHQLLDFSKPNPPAFKISNVCDVMRETLDLLSNDFLKRKINIIENCENHSLMANIDPTQIKQVILNILLNAIDAMPKGGNIYISAKAIESNNIEICITDEGIGISKENLKNIFNPFFTTKDEGTGLGLGICHQIIKNHKGLIGIESEENKGTTVRIKLPLSNYK